MPRLARLAALVAFALVLCSPAVALADPATTTLHVEGHGRVFVMPDIATVTINVNRSGPTRQLARRRVNTVVARIVRGLVGIGIVRPSIQTSSVTLSTTHRRHHPTSYDAEIDLTVTTTHISLLSPLFDVASRAGATSYQGPNFDFSNPSAGLIDATNAALRDARARADAAAATLGLHVVGCSRSTSTRGPGRSLFPASGRRQAPRPPRRSRRRCCPAARRSTPPSTSCTSSGADRGLLGSEPRMAGRIEPRMRALAIAGRWRRPAAAGGGCATTRAN